MGQMTHAVMYGVKKNPPKGLAEGWYSLISQYKPDSGPRPDTPHGDGDWNFLGFWVAAGDDGVDGCPYLSEPFALDDFANVKAYKAATARAVKAWAKFAAWCEDRGTKLPAPRLYLVETEVA